MAPTAIDRVYQDIRERIIRLELAPGEQLVESQLAEQLGASSISVHEALKMMATESLVDIVPQRGVYVAEITLNDLQEIAELRTEIEALSARLAAGRITPEQIAGLRALAMELAGLKPDDTDNLMRADRQLHLGIAEAAGNKHLMQILSGLYDKSLRLWRMALPRVGRLADMVERHDEVVDALEYGNAEHAAEVMRAHVAEFHDSIREAF